MDWKSSAVMRLQTAASTTAFPDVPDAIEAWSAESTGCSALASAAGAAVAAGAGVAGAEVTGGPEAGTAAAEEAAAPEGAAATASPSPPEQFVAFKGSD